MYIFISVLFTKIFAKLCIINKILFFVQFMEDYLINFLDGSEANNIYLALIYYCEAPMSEVERNMYHVQSIFI